MPDLNLPPSLAVSPNIPWEDQTVEQLEAERAYWEERVATAAGFASAKCADSYRRACEAWIKRRQREALTQREQGDATNARPQAL